tara:strand:- start:8813 stop:9355 length:543 start_codon:yes stop_codon:yes gene_type:complete
MKPLSQNNDEESRSEQFKRAMALVEKGNLLVSKNKLHEARECYRKSVEIYPTADAYTYLGWLVTYNGHYLEAMDLCFKAIEIDPDFGNPYNDIGVYLLRMGKMESSIKWFERAIKAPRYEPRHFPHINLVQVFMKQGKLSRALKHVEIVLEYDPDNEQSKKLKSILEPIVHIVSGSDIVN